MADDNLLLNAIQTGANIGNMRVMRQERMMELQSQEAMRQIEERNLVQQMNIRSQLFQKQMEQDAQDKADLASFASLYKERMDHDTAAAQLAAQDMPGAPAVDVNKIAKDNFETMIPVLATKNTSAATKLVNSIKPLIQDQTRMDLGQLRSQTQENIATGRNAVSLQNAQTNAEARKYAADQHLAATVARLKESGMGHEAATTFAEKGCWRCAWTR